MSVALLSKLTRLNPSILAWEKAASIEAKLGSTKDPAAFSIDTSGRLAFG